MIVKTIMWVVVAFAVVVGLIMFFLFIRYFNLWLRGYVTRAGVSPFNLIFMSLRKVNPQTIVEAKISAVQAGLAHISTQALSAHYLAGGNVTKVVRALIASHRARIPLDWIRHRPSIWLGVTYWTRCGPASTPRSSTCPIPSGQGHARWSR